MSRRKKIAIRVLLVIAVLLGVGIILFFSFRESLLQEAITKVKTKMERDYNAKLSIKTAEFDGLTAVKLTEISLVPNNADTLFSIKRI